MVLWFQTEVFGPSVFSLKMWFGEELTVPMGTGEDIWFWNQILNTEEELEL